MSLTQEQIEKLSLNLSKIRLNTGKLGNNIQEILSYIDLLNELDTTWVEPTNSVIEKDNELREDSIWENKVDPMDLLACSEQKVISRQVTISNIMK